MRDIKFYVDAIAAAQEASNVFFAEPDSGSCNLDTVIIDFSGWRSADIARLQSASGLSIGDKMSSPFTGYRFVFFKTNGQAYRNTKMVEAAASKLKELGISASVWYKMD